MLSDRRQRVLSALIEEYVARAMPVGSRTLTERYHLGVSSATVRNDLSALEDAGFITQPHTSAGRIPTDAGYREFVDELLSSELFNEASSPYQDIIDDLRKSSSELDALLEKTSEAMARLTDCLSIVVAPSVLSSHIRQLSLISLSNYRALIVLVVEDGQVLNRQVSFSEEVTADDLAHVQKILGNLIVGKSIREFKETFDAQESKNLHEPLVQLILDEVFACVQDSNLAHAHRLGMSSLMKKPEFRTSSSLLPIMEVLEDNTVLFHVFDDAENNGSNQILVRIGEENAADALSGVSVVASSYDRGEGEGIVAIIGPTRMDYSRVIRAVRTAERILHEE